MENNVLSIYDEDYLKSKIYVIRGVQVMLDSDLAEIYGYETKNFNRQIKNNIERFDEDMRFQLTNTEYDVLRCNFCTSKISTTNCKPINQNETSVLRSKNPTSKQEKRGGRKYLPYAFTEQGVYMLMSVLKGELAVSQSKKLIKLFKRMKDFVVQMQNVLPASEIGMLAIQTRVNTEDIRLIKEQMVTRDEKIFHCGGSSKDGGRKVTSIFYYLN